MIRAALQELLFLLIIISFVCPQDQEFPSFPASHADHQYGGPHYALADSSDPAIAEAREAERCKFPFKWEGKWFESGEGSDTIISITRSTINTKGRCVEAEGEKYIIFNEREYCYRCLVFHEKHYNVLQYKETFCVPQRRLIKDFCSTISGDANLHAMFRLDAVPVECPFQGSYTFTYNRGNKECRYPTSTIESCLQPSRVQLNFQACPDVMESEGKSEELRCLATWREGSSRYLLGLIKYNYPASYEESFRCFIYEKLNRNYARVLSSTGTENGTFRIAQSGDATCNGLSFTEFSRMMTLKKTPTLNPCQFPPWLLIHSQWHTLNQRSSFVFHNNGILRVYNSSDTNTLGQNSATMAATCSQMLEDPAHFKAILHSTTDCNSGYVCCTIHRRDGHIVEIQLGSMARKAEDACHHNYFNGTEQPFITLVSSTPKTRQCPNLGKFQVMGVIRNGQSLQTKSGTREVDLLKVGCTSLDTFQIQSQYHDLELNSEYSCHGTWEESGVNYLVANRLPQTSGIVRRYCFIFRENVNVPMQERLKSSRNGPKLSDSSALAQSDNKHGKLLQFSILPETCRRNLVAGIEGSFAFNVTENGDCNDLSSSPGCFRNTFLNSYQLVMLVLTGRALRKRWT